MVVVVVFSRDSRTKFFDGVGWGQWIEHKETRRWLIGKIYLLNDRKPPPRLDVPVVTGLFMPRDEVGGWMRGN